MPVNVGAVVAQGARSRKSVHSLLSLKSLRVEDPRKKVNEMLKRASLANQNAEDSVLSSEFASDSNFYSESIQAEKEASVDNQQEIRFMLVVNDILVKSPVRLFQKDTMKRAFKLILERSPEQPVNYSVQELQKCKVKCKDYREFILRFNDIQREELEKANNRSMFDYKVSETIRKDLQQLDEDQATFEQQIQNLIHWFQQAIDQNIGQFQVHEKAVTYDRNSLYLFSWEQPFRQRVVWLTEWRWFDSSVILLILVGSVCQAMYDFQEEDSEYN
jgi:hypothetical protein